MWDRFDGSLLAHVEERASGALGTSLQRQIHRLEAATRGAVDASRQQRYQESGEDLAMDESRPTSPEGLDREDVLAVEEAAHHQMAAPAKLTPGLDLQHAGSERHAPGIRQLNADDEPGADAEIALHPTDERIPEGKRREVSQRDPHPVGRRCDLDLRAQFLHPTRIWDATRISSGGTLVGRLSQLTGPMPTLDIDGAELA